jgi:4-nitrophenyl phosphatase
MKNDFDFSTIHALIIDMDGVLWRGDALLPGFGEIFDFLQSNAIPFVLATNNARKTPAQYLSRFANYGVTLEPKNLLTSSLVAADYLQNELSAGAKIYIIGEDGLYEAMKEAGYIIVDDSSEPVEAVVASLDMKVTYDKLKHATFLIRGGARFIGTNGDLSYPVEAGFAPGAGSILAALEAATGITPTVLGKPERLMFDVALQKMNSKHQHTVMIGDRLETDILGAQKAGLRTILVTSGIDNEDSIQTKNIKPDIVLKGIDEMVATWRLYR